MDNKGRGTVPGQVIVRDCVHDPLRKWWCKTKEECKKKKERKAAQHYLHMPETATPFKGLCDLCDGTVLHPHEIPQTTGKRHIKLHKFPSPSSS